MTCSDTAPRYRTRITQRLRDLRTASRKAALPVGGQVSTSPARDPRRDIPAEAGPMRLVRLRVDGRRPLRFRGTLLWSARQEHLQSGSEVVRQALSVFLSDAEDLVAALSLEMPGPDPSFRPVHQAVRAPDSRSMQQALSSLPLWLPPGYTDSSAALRSDRDALISVCLRPAFPQ